MAETPRTVREAGESAVLSLLRRPGDEHPPGDLVGNGDDAAVLGPAAATVLTTDMLVEGTHFRLDLSSWRDVGRRAVAQNVSDVAAMGAECSRVLVALCLPGDTPLDGVAELAAGLHEEAGRYGALLVGGDVTGGERLVVCVTAAGVLAEGERPVPIDGGRPGDVLALTGAPGRSAAGLELLLAGHREGALQDVHRVPELPAGAGAAARRAGASALTDVSDGLLRDLAGVARASGCAVELDGAALVPGDELLDAARLLTGGSGARRRALEWVYDGGEDHGLLAAFPPDIVVPAPFRVVGRLVAGEPGCVRVDGVVRIPGGWDSARAPGGAG